MRQPRLRRSTTAPFLRSLSKHFGRLSRDTLTLNLAMARYDIANYPGLVVGVGSRLFTKMEAAGVLAVSRKHIVIPRMDLLATKCGLHGAWCRWWVQGA